MPGTILGIENVVVNKTEFLSCILLLTSIMNCFSETLAFSMIQQMLAIWSLVPLPFLKPA